MVISTTMLTFVWIILVAYISFSGGQPGNDDVRPASSFDYGKSDLQKLHPWTDFRSKFYKNLLKPELQPPNYEELYVNEGENVLENDMIIPSNLIREANGTITERNFFANENFHWPSSQIPVIIDPDAPFSRKQRALILDGLQQYHQHTCVRFVQRTNEKDYIFITHDDRKGCMSHVGRQGGRQVLYLRIPGCVTLIGTTIHELLHNFGFFHEHSRPDRDKNVKIMWNDIIPGFERNFQSYSPATVDTLEQPYDYDSVMHYSALAFTKDKSVYTIYPLNGKPSRLGQRLKFSETDIAKVNRAFHCQKNLDPQQDSAAKDQNSDTNRSTKPDNVCENGGIDAAVWHRNELYLFRKNRFWTYKSELSVPFISKQGNPTALPPRTAALLSPDVSTAVDLDDHVYMFSNSSVVAVTSLKDDSVVDIAETTKFFKPLVWNPKGAFRLENRLFFSDGVSLHVYNPLADTIVGILTFSKLSGLPEQHDLIFNIGNGRIMMTKEQNVYVTKPNQLIIEDGFPANFSSIFCRQD